MSKRVPKENSMEPPSHPSHKQRYSESGSSSDLVVSSRGSGEMISTEKYSTNHKKNSRVNMSKSLSDDKYIQFHPSSHELWNRKGKGKGKLARKTDFIKSMFIAEGKGKENSRLTTKIIKKGKGKPTCQSNSSTDIESGERLRNAKKSVSFQEDDEERIDGRSKKLLGFIEQTSSQEFSSNEEVEFDKKDETRVVKDLIAMFKKAPKKSKLRCKIKCLINVELFWKEQEGRLVTNLQKRPQDKMQNAVVDWPNPNIDYSKIEVLGSLKVSVKDGIYRTFEIELCGNRLLYMDSEGFRKDLFFSPATIFSRNIRDGPFAFKIQNGSGEPTYMDAMDFENLKRIILPLFVCAEKYKAHYPSNSTLGYDPLHPASVFGTAHQINFVVDGDENEMSPTRTKFGDGNRSQKFSDTSERHTEKSSFGAPSFEVAQERDPRPISIAPELAVPGAVYMDQGGRYFMAVPSNSTNLKSGTMLTASVF